MRALKLSLLAVAVCFALGVSVPPALSLTSFCVGTCSGASSEFIYPCSTSSASGCCTLAKANACPSGQTFQGVCEGDAEVNC